jgi:hypothetical protein
MKMHVKSLVASVVSRQIVPALDDLAGFGASILGHNPLEGKFVASKFEPSV